MLPRRGRQTLPAGTLCERQWHRNCIVPSLSEEPCNASRKTAEFMDWDE